MKTFLLFSLLLSSLIVSAQDIKTDRITWKVNQGNDTAAKKNFAYNCVFKTDSDGKILWLQKNGTFNIEYSILSVEGSWTDVNKSGKITYNLTEDGGDARLQFEKSGSGTAITLVILPEGTKYVFKVFDVVIEK